MKYKYTCEKCNIEFERNKPIRRLRRIRCDICKRKVDYHKDINTITSILELSSRTVEKILKRMNLGCSYKNCGWKESSCDIHHINGRKILNHNAHSNLSFLCPNHHRMADNNLIRKEDLISLDIQIGDSWKQYYHQGTKYNIK